MLILSHKGLYRSEVRFGRSRVLHSRISPGLRRVEPSRCGSDRAPARCRAPALLRPPCLLAGLLSEKEVFPARLVLSGPRTDSARQFAAAHWLLNVASCAVSVRYGCICAPGSGRRGRCAARPCQPRHCCRFQFRAPLVRNLIRPSSLACVPVPVSTPFGEHCRPTRPQLQGVVPTRVSRKPVGKNPAGCQNIRDPTTRKGPDFGPRSENYAPESTSEPLLFPSRSGCIT